MVKHLVLLLSILLIGCEMNSEQLIKSEITNFENIKFDAVSKDLQFKNSQTGKDVENTKNLINIWFNNSIKINGFQGNLSVIVNSIEIRKVKRDEFYRFEIDLDIVFIETNEILNKKRSYNINSIEYGDIQGSFSISDTENLNNNIIIKSLKNINQKLIDIN